MPARCIAAVALYGAKTGALKRFLERVQEICSEKLDERFVPYTLDQIHGTVIRLDGIIHSDTGLLVNEHYRRLAGTPHTMDVVRAIELLSAHFTLPLSIRIGGFTPNDPVKFLSRGQRPYQRMFSAQDGALVLVGWPIGTVVNGISCRPLDLLRREMNQANILHWYHKSWDDVDNDFHLVIGHYENVRQHEITKVVDAASIYLRHHQIQLEVGLRQLAIVAASTPTLATAEIVCRFPVNTTDITDLYRWISPSPNRQA